MKYIPDQPDKGTVYLAELRGAKCRCGRDKHPGKSFCSRCYYTLPRMLRRALYRRIGRGYEAAYENACNFIAEKEVTDGA